MKWMDVPKCINQGSRVTSFVKPNVWSNKLKQISDYLIITILLLTNSYSSYRSGRLCGFVTAASDWWADISRIHRQICTSSYISRIHRQNCASSYQIHTSQASYYFFWIEFAWIWWPDSSRWEFCGILIFPGDSHLGRERGRKGERNGNGKESGEGEGERSRAKGEKCVCVCIQSDSYRLQYMIFMRQCIHVFRLFLYALIIHTIHVVWVRMIEICAKQSKIKQTIRTAQFHFQLKLEFT